jgi:hypothetical protein
MRRFEVQSSNNTTWESDERTFMINYSRRQQRTEVQVTGQDGANDILRERVNALSYIIF